MKKKQLCNLSAEENMVNCSVSAYKYFICSECGKKVFMYPHHSHKNKRIMICAICSLKEQNSYLVTKGVMSQEQFDEELERTLEKYKGFYDI